MLKIKLSTGFQVKYKIVLLVMLMLWSQLSSAAITPDEQAVMRLMQLSDIPTQASIDEVVTLANEGSNNEIRQQFIFTALTRIGPSVSGDDYAKSVLDAGTAGTQSLRGALGYLAEHATHWMNPYAETYLAVTKPAEVRCMAAYLAGMLGMSAQKDIIVTILNDPTNGDWRLHAARGLAYLVPIAEFTTLVDATNLKEWDKYIAKTNNKFLQETDANKEQMLSTMLGRADPSLQLIALRYLFANDKIGLLKQHGLVSGDDTSITMSNKSIDALARILGYTVNGNINAITINSVTFQ